MKTALQSENSAIRWLTSGLLFFTGASGLIGGVPLIFDPHGSPWGMPQTLLFHSPFHSYLIPGIVLFCLNGLLPIVISLLALRGARHYEALAAAQGLVLFGWIVVECIMIRLVIWPHYLYAGIGMALFTCSAFLWRAARHGAPAESLLAR